jgi:peptide/nickel transport system permease protein
MTVAVETKTDSPGVEGAGKPSAPAKPKATGEFLFFALRSKKFLVSLAILGFLFLLAVFGPILDPIDPAAQAGRSHLPILAKPNLAPGQWFGTTIFGEDVFAQVTNGLRASFFEGLLGGGLAALIAMVIGFWAGYRGGWWDEVLSMLTNVILVIPTLALLLVLVAYLQSTPIFGFQARGVFFESIFIGLTSWPWAARAIRAQTFSLRSRDFVDLAKLSGRRGLRIVVEEVVPNMSSYLFLTFILLFGGAILIAASLDFIGLGPVNGFSLGLVLYNSVTYGAALQLGIWWWFFPPGLLITALVGALYVMNVGLDEIFNPKLREM